VDDGLKTKRIYQNQNAVIPPKAEMTNQIYTDVKKPLHLAMSGFFIDLLFATKQTIKSKKYYFLAASAAFAPAALAASTAAVAAAPAASLAAPAAAVAAPLAVSAAAPAAALDASAAAPAAAVAAAPASFAASLAASTTGATTAAGAAGASTFGASTLASSFLPQAARAAAAITAAITIDLFMRESLVINEIREKQFPEIVKTPTLSITPC
jgi:hypothetical protein